MKITGLRARALYAELLAPMRSRGSVGYTEFFHTGSERQRITTVEVLTDAGLTGVTLLSGDAREWIERVGAPALAGQDPRAIRHCRRRIMDREGGTPHRGHRNRLEFALWDLSAQSAGLPLFRFLGGTDPRVEVYAGGGSLCWNPLPLLVEEAEAMVRRGFRALKVKIGHGPEEDAAILPEIREACGDGIRLMVDANRAYDLDGARALCRDLEALGVYWFEEPLVYDDPAGWRALRESTTVKITGGEGFSSLRQTGDALREGIVEILQCDAGAFGLEELLAIGSMAAETGVALTPHSCNTAIGFVVSCHLQRALPNAEIQEFETFENPFIGNIFREPFTLADGKVLLPETPGLGVTLNEEVVERYLVP